MATLNTDLGTLIAAIYDSTEAGDVEIHRDSLVALATYEILCEHSRRALAARLLVESVGYALASGVGDESEARDLGAGAPRAQTV